MAPRNSGKAMKRARFMDKQIVRILQEADHRALLAKVAALWGQLALDICLAQEFGSVDTHDLRRLKK
jgi:hypothetical protein